MKDRASSVKVGVADNNETRGGHILHEQEYITQDMAYRQSLMKYAEKFGVSRASRKYNKGRSYIYFWKARWDGTVESLACQSRRPHSHPNQHTEAEMKLIQDMRRRNPNLRMVELWHRLRQRGYTRRPESLFRVMRKLGLFPPQKKKTIYHPKPYEQMTYPGQRVQVDVKVVPRKCISDPELHLFQYTAIDEFTRLRFLAALTPSSPPFPQPISSKGLSGGMHAAASGWSVSRPTTALSSPTVFPTANEIALLCLKLPLHSWASATSSSVPTPHATMERSSAAIGRIRSVSTLTAAFTSWTTSLSNSLSTIAAPTSSP